MTALAVVLAAGLAVQGVRARDDAARLAAVPGVLRPVAPPLDDLWRRSREAWGSGPGDHDITVSLRRTPTGHAVLALERSGSRRWTTELPVRAPAVGWRAERILHDVVCVPLGTVTPADQVVACRVLVPASSAADPVGLGLESRLVVLDARTGDHVADWRLGGYSTIAPLGGDLLVVDALVDGHQRVRRYDPVAGHARWTFRSRQEVPQGDLGPAFGVAQAAVERGVIVVSGLAAWALTQDGSLLHEWYPDDEVPVEALQPLDVSVLPDGRFAVSGLLEPGRLGEPTGTVTDSATAEELRFSGRVLRPEVTDGSGDDVLLTVPANTSQIAALDAGTGALLWQKVISVESDVIVMDERLVTTTGRELVALEVATGEVIWTTGPRRMRTVQQLFTDGRVVLVPATDEAGENVLTAFGLDDGRVRWTVPVLHAVEGYESVAGELVVLTQQWAFGVG